MIKKYFSFLCFVLFCFSILPGSTQLASARSRYRSNKNDIFYWFKQNKRRLKRHPKARKFYFDRSLIGEWMWVRNFDDGQHAVRTLSYIVDYISFNINGTGMLESNTFSLEEK